MLENSNRLHRGAIARLLSPPGHGFIVRGWMGASEIPFDARDLENVGFDQLHVGQSVEFFVISSSTGLHARQVRILDDQS